MHQIIFKLVLFEVILQINIFNIESPKIKVYNFYYRGIVMENFYFNSSTIFKYLRKVLNEINKVYVDSGIRSAFLMKRYC